MKKAKKIVSVEEEFKQIQNKIAVLRDRGINQSKQMITIDLFRERVRLEKIKTAQQLEDLYALENLFASRHEELKVNLELRKQIVLESREYFNY